MINAKVKVINETNEYSFEKEVNNFLEDIDIRQIVKSEFSTSCSSTGGVKYSVMIYYVGIDDVRDAKIDNILEIK
jgi:hypothetical protein